MSTEEWEDLVKLFVGNSGHTCIVSLIEEFVGNWSKLYSPTKYVQTK